MKTIFLVSKYLFLLERTLSSTYVNFINMETIFVNLLIDNKSYSPYLLHGPTHSDPREERTLNICLLQPRCPGWRLPTPGWRALIRLQHHLKARPATHLHKPGEPFNKINLAATYHHVPTVLLSGSGQN